MARIVHRYIGQRQENGVCTITRDGQRLEEVSHHFRVAYPFPRWSWGEMSDATTRTAYALLAEFLTHRLAAALAVRMAVEVLCPIKRDEFSFSTSTLMAWASGACDAEETAVCSPRG